MDHRGGMAGAQQGKACHQYPGELSRYPGRSEEDQSNQRVSLSGSMGRGQRMY